MVQGKINRGRHTDHPTGRHSIRTKQCPPPPSPEKRPLNWCLWPGRATGQWLPIVSHKASEDAEQRTLSSGVVGDVRQSVGLSRMHSLNHHVSTCVVTWHRWHLVTTISRYVTCTTSTCCQCSYNWVQATNLHQTVQKHLNYTHSVKKKQLNNFASNPGTTILLQIQLQDLLYINSDWLNELRFFTTHSTQKTVHFGDVLPRQSLGVALKKLNVTQQKHTYTNKL